MSRHVMGRGLPRLLAGLFVSAAVTSVAVPVLADDYIDYLKREHGTLGKTGASRVLDVVTQADPNAGDIASTAQHFSILAPINPESGVVTGRPTLDGVISLTISSRTDRPFYATAQLLFDDVASRDKFVVALEGLLGAADPACSNERIAHFLPGPKHTVIVGTPDPDSPEAQIEITGDDPVDANCARSASPRDHLVNEAQLKTYLERLRDDVPPLDDLAATQAWLAPYGVGEVTSEGDCDASMVLPSWDADPRPALVGLEGFNYIDASVAPCPGENPKVNYVALTAHFGADMFGMDKAIAVATETYGTPADDCGEPYLHTWELDGERTVMVTEINRGFAVVHYDTLLEEHNC